MDNLNKLKNKALILTTSPGVYLMKNSREEIIYVGKAKNLKNRVVSYFRNFSAQNEKVRKMVENVEDFDFIVTSSEFEALVLECSLIKQHKPKYNILLKDSKGYRYIKISDEDFPKITVCSKKKCDNAEYIGPYVNSFSVKQAVQEVNRIFMLPVCKQKLGETRKNKRPCLNYYIKQCMGVCCKKVSKDEYLNIIKEAIKYIKNGDIVSIEYMRKQMKKAADEQDFERAIKFRDRIFAIERVHQTQKVYLQCNLNADVIAFSTLEDEICFVILKFKNGRISDKEDFIFKNITGLENVKEEFLAGYYYKKEFIPPNILLNFELLNMSLYSKYLNEQAKHSVNVTVPTEGIFKNLTSMAYENSKEILNLRYKDYFKENKNLKELKNLLNLENIPKYIESYDISNLGDSSIVGAMVVFKDGVPFKKNYRKFKIKTINKRDDYASMREVLLRRIKRYAQGEDESFSILPDLILLDGGEGHVAAVRDIFLKENFNVPFFGLVKDGKHKTRAISSTHGEISITAKRNVFLLLSKIQEEVHRFTITYQRNLRKNYMLKLSISNIEGVGEKTAEKILKHFDSYKDIKNSSSQYIAKIAHISIKKAQYILNYLQENT